MPRYFILKTFTEDEAATCKRCNMPEVVMCKDCKYGSREKNGNGENVIQCFNDDLWMTGDLHMPDWFCADGERRDGNA